MRKSDFNEVLILADYPATRMPLNEFRTDEEQSVYKIVYGEESLRGLAIQHEVVPALDVVELFPVSAEAVSVIKRYFPQATVHGFYSQTLKATYAHHMRTDEAEGRRMYVSVEGEEMLICHYEGERLRYANTFAETSIDDRLYFILSVWQLLELDQEADALVLLGDDKAIEKELKRYVRTVVCE